MKWYRHKMLAPLVRERYPDQVLHICEVGVNRPRVTAFGNLLEDTRHRITLVEPLPWCARALRTKFTHAQVHEVAITSSGDDILSMCICGEHGNGLSYVIGADSPEMQRKDYVPHEHPDRRILRVKAVPFTSIDDGTIDVMSIDVEGSEWEVISGLRSRPRLVAIELENPVYTNSHRGPILDWFHDEGYTPLPDRIEYDHVFVRDA